MKEHSIYRTIFENTGTAIVIIEKDSVVSLVNSEFEKMSGYSKEEVEGKMSWQDFVAPQDIPFMEERFNQRQVDPDAVPHNYEFRFIDRSGAVKQIYLTIDMIPGTDKAVGSLLDITENHKTRQALEYRIEFERIVSRISRMFINLSRYSIDRGIDNALKTIGEFTSSDRAYVFIITPDGKRMSNTHEWCAEGVTSQKEQLQDLKPEDSAWTFEQLTKYRNINVSNIDDLPEEALFERNLLKKQRIRSYAVVPLAYENALKGFLGLDAVYAEKEWLEDDFTLLRTAGDIIVNALERKIFEEQLEESRRKYQAFVNFLPQVVFECDTDGNLGFANRYAYQLFGYTKEDFEKGTSVYSMLAEEERERAKKNFGRVLLGATTEGNEYTGITKGGKRFPILIYSSPAYESGRLAGIRGIIIDITVRKLLEEQLKQSQKLEAVGRLAGGIAHDFNNILTSIIGFSHMLLLSEELTAECKDEVENILSIAKSGSNLTRQLLAFSRKQIVNLKNINLNDLVRKTIKMLRRLLNEKIELTTELCSPLGLIRMDEGQMEQIVMNLVLNSSDALPEGGDITLRTGEVCLSFGDKTSPDTPPEGEYVLLQVLDNGYGMEESVKEKVLEPFFTTKEMGKGTGLGLSMVYGIVRQNGGYLEIESEQGEGTSITVYLPRYAGTAEGGEPAAVSGAGVSKPSARVLVVEDDPEVRKVLARMLESMGFFVFRAEDGEAAVSMLESESEVPFDLVISDVVMPGMSGQKLADEIGKKYPGTRVLLVSGHTDDESVRKSVEAKSRDYLQKPFSIDTLRAKINEMLI